MTDIKKCQPSRRNTISGQYDPKNPKKYVGKYPIIYRSSWELRLMKHFDAHPSVLQWSSESITIPYFNPIDRSMHRYFPDFTILRKSSAGELIKEIIEVKPEAQTMKPKMATKKGSSVDKYMREMAEYVKNCKKWEAAQYYAKKTGHVFRIITEKNLF